MGKERDQKIKTREDTTIKVKRPPKRRGRVFQVGTARKKIKPEGTA